MSSDPKTKQTPEKQKISTEKEKKGRRDRRSSFLNPDSITEEIEAEKAAKLHERALPGNATTDRELPLYIHYLFQASNALLEQDWLKHSREFAIHAHNLCDDYAEKDRARDAAAKKHTEAIREGEADLLMEDSWLEFAAVLAEGAFQLLKEAGL